MFRFDLVAIPSTWSGQFRRPTLVFAVNLKHAWSQSHVLLRSVPTVDGEALARQVEIRSS